MTNTGNQPDPLTRRLFLQRALAAGALTAGGATMAGCGVFGTGDRGLANRSGPTGAATAASKPKTGSPPPRGSMTADAVSDRVLVVVDLQGGNDGLSTLVPYGDGRYYDLRPELSIPDSEVLAIDDQVGFHPALAGLHRRGAATVEGVGPIDGDLSHFAMAARWQRGDVDGSDPFSRTGFLARVVDTLDDGGPLVGVSTGGPSPYLSSATAATLSLTSPDQLWMLQPTDWDEVSAFQRRLAEFDDGSAPWANTGLGSVADGYDRLLGLAADLDNGEDEIDWDQPMLANGGDLGRQLYLAADLVAAEVGTRVIYARTGDYDTHSGHQWRQAENLGRVDAAVDGFLGRAETLGFADRVVVATVSEFGRRVPENGNGLDHGVASTMLLAGAGVGGQHGERPDLDGLDDGDNIPTAIGFDRYLASLAEEWLGIEAASVLSTEPDPLGLFS